MNADKQRILAEIKRLASGGKAPGVRAFETATGIKESDWCPEIWLRSGDAVKEASFAPNVMVEARSNESLLKSYAGLTRRLGHPPIQGELIRESKANASFPSEKSFRRFGGKSKLLSALRAYCATHSGFDDVLTLCGVEATSQSNEDHVAAVRKSVATGFVYLMKSGRHYKIGHTNSLGRREWELGIKIPIPPQTIHHIETDDPVGIEKYWHKRFDEKRGEGEWFSLTADDVAAFKRWKRIV